MSNLLYSFTTQCLFTSHLSLKVCELFEKLCNREYRVYCYLLVVLLVFELCVCSHLSAGQCVPGQFDFSKVAFADGLQQSIAANVWLFICDGRHGAAAWRQTVTAG